MEVRLLCMIQHQEPRGPAGPQHVLLSKCLVLRVENLLFGGCLYSMSGKGKAWLPL